MAFPRHIVRTIVPQPLTQFVVSVQVTPTQISPLFTKADLIDSFTISVDAGAANNVFIGDQGVTITNGTEIVAGGGPVNYVIRNQWQLYDVLNPLMDINRTLLNCAVDQQEPVAIPYIVWDLSQIYLVAVAVTSVRISPFRSQFI